MKNYVQPGDVITLVAPYAVGSGGGAVVGSIFGVATNEYANGATGEFATKGVFDLTALSTATFAQGAKVYWDNTNKRCAATATGYFLIGVAVNAKANGETTARVRLNGVAITAEA